MTLPAAGLILLVVETGLVLLVSVVFGCLTFHRNSDYRSAVSIWQDTIAKAPQSAGACDALGSALSDLGQLDEAIALHQRALKIKPDYVPAHYNLGNAYLRQGRFEEAMAQFREILETRPRHALAHNNLGVALGNQGRVAKAADHYRKALEINPDYAEAHFNLGLLWCRQGECAKGLTHWREGLRLQPDDVAVLNLAAQVLATCPDASIRDGSEAVELAERAVRISGGRDPEVLGTLAAAYAEAGRFPEAAETARQALALAGARNDAALADALRARIPLYQAARAR